MFRTIKPFKTTIAGFIAIAALTSCAQTDTQGIGSNGVGGIGEKDPITTELEERVPGSLETGAIELGTLLRSQQTHYLVNGKFAAGVEELEIAIASDDFDFQLTDLDDQNHVIIAQPTTEDLIAYAGGVHVGTELSQSEAMIICAADAGTEIAPPSWAEGKWTCAAGSSPTK